VLRTGVMASGLFMDEIRLIDYLTADIEETIFSAMINSPKLPYTDEGVQVLKNLILGVLNNSVTSGALANDPRPTVSAPKAIDQSANDRAHRYFPGIKFTARLAGAIHTIDIQGVVTA